MAGNEDEKNENSPPPEADDELTVMDEPMVDDDKPLPRGVRPLLILLAVGILGGGLYMNHRRIRKLQDRARKSAAPAAAGKASQLPVTPPPPAEAYPWLKNYDPANGIASRIPPPGGFRRVAVRQGSFAHWLRHLPLRAGYPDVFLHTGRAKRNQKAHFAVIEIDTGARDLQQCADAVMRLRAEYLYAADRWPEIHFNFTSGDRADWSAWLAGSRPIVKGRKVTWKQKAGKDDSHAGFRKYLDTVFIYAGTISLEKELAPVPAVADMRIGDVFIHGGSPGHSVIVVDMIENPRTSQRGFLLVQSFMPAQDMHVLVNPHDEQSGPWYPQNFGPKLQTPEWTFQPGELKRFKQNGKN